MRSATVADGFTAMKTGGVDRYADCRRFKPAAFVARIGALRAAVGPDIGIMVNDHGRAALKHGAAWMHALRPLRPVESFEEPTQPDDLEGLQRLRRRSADGPATGERLFSKWGPPTAARAFLSM